MIEETNTAEPTKIWNKNFISVMSANFLLGLAHFSVNPLVATYAEYLDANHAMIGFLAGMFFLVALAMRPFSGPVTTKIDNRKLLVFAFILGAIANLGYAMFQYIPAFIFFRVIHGVQFSLIGMLLMILAANHLPPTKIVAGMGIFGIGAAISSAVAPAIGELILTFGTAYRGEAFGFSLMFLFGSVVSIIAIIPSLIIAPDRKTAEDIKNAGAWYKNVLSKHAVLLAFIVFLMMVPFAMVSSYMFDFGREQDIPGISIFYLVLALALAASRPFSGMLTDKFGLGQTMFPGLVIYAASLIIIGSSTTFGMVIVGAVVVAIGYGAVMPPLQAMCMQMETPVRRGVASNTLYIGLDLGLFIGPVIGGFVRELADFALMFKASSIAVVAAIVMLAIMLPQYHRRLNDLSK